MTLILIQQCPISNLSELFSYTTFSNCLLIDQLPFRVIAKNTHTHTPDEYSIVYKTQLQLFAMSTRDTHGVNRVQAKYHIKKDVILEVH